MNNQQIIEKCKLLLDAYKQGKLGNCTMPEDSNPNFKENEAETRLIYFTLPMSLNYQRDSYNLWKSVLATYKDEETKKVFSIENSAKMSTEELRKILLKYKIALQPNKHISTWQTIAKTIDKEWGSMLNLIKSNDSDYLKLRETIQKQHKKGFPYLSGPKIFNYWCFILREYGKINLKNDEYIEIAPDTHITQCSVKLGIITPEEAATVSKEIISARWRSILEHTAIKPIEMHPPLWFWSRNNFQFQLS